MIVAYKMANSVEMFFCFRGLNHLH